MTISLLILGDNLEILKSMEADSVDLIYLDPPLQFYKKQRRMTL
jgi:DNA modification methylase